MKIFMKQVPICSKHADTTSHTTPRHYLILAVLFFFMACWMFAIEERLEDEAVADALAPYVLRFHVLAASDAESDQALKLEVRDFFLTHLQEKLSSRPDTGKQEILAYIGENRERLENAVNAFLAQKGVHDTVSLETATVHFPTRNYGNLVFPCGDYEAVRLLIGPAKGHNWWCVLYPSLCFTEESGPYLPEDSCRQLEQMIGETMYKTLLSHQPSAPETCFQTHFEPSPEPSSKAPFEVSLYLRRFFQS